MITRNRLAILLLVIGSLQMIGYFAHSRVLRGLGAASGVAPFPKVFCEAEGYEGFAASFSLVGTREDHTEWKLPLTPESYSRIRGPYNRRNVYGAAFAYAPRLPEQARQTLLSEALAPGSPIRKELNIPADLQEISIIITPRSGEEPTAYRYSVSPLPGPSSL